MKFLIEQKGKEIMVAVGMMEKEDFYNRLNLDFVKSPRET